jgi:GNAT superfamily N-acetyltransferase
MSIVQVRPGKKNDLTQVLELIRELAEYEHMADQVSNTVERMEEDGFGENPIFGFLVADEGGHLVGASIYYYRYSTWKGRRLYLEDIIVTESQRGKGIRKRLLEETIEVAKRTKCTGMMWQVLDWNTPAIEFYKKYPVTFDNGWVNCNLDF